MVAALQTCQHLAHGRVGLELFVHGKRMAAVIKSFVVLAECRVNGAQVHAFCGCVPSVDAAHALANVEDAELQLQRALVVTPHVLDHGDIGDGYAYGRRVLVAQFRVYTARAWEKTRSASSSLFCSL